MKIYTSVHICRAHIWNWRHLAIRVHLLQSKKGPGSAKKTFPCSLARLISSASPFPPSTMLRHAPVCCVTHGPFRFDGMYACAGQHCLCGEGGGGGLCAERGQRCLFGREMEGKEAMRPINSNRAIFLVSELVSMREHNTQCKRAFTANSTRDVFFADPGVGFDERKQHKMQAGFFSQLQRGSLFRRCRSWALPSFTWFLVTAQ